MGSQYERLTRTVQEEGVVEDADAFPVRDREHIRWLDLISTSRHGEKMRAKARDLLSGFVYLKSRAVLYEAKESVARLEAAVAAAETTSARTMKTMELKRAQEQLDSLKDEFCASDDDMSTMQAEYKEWIHTVNALTPTAFAQYVATFSVDLGQQDLAKLLDSLCLELPWDRAKRRLKDIPRLHQSIKDANLFLTDRESLIFQSQSLEIIGHQLMDETCNIDRFRAKVSTEKFLEELVGWRRALVVNRLVMQALNGDRQVCFKMRYAITPATQLVRMNNLDLAMVLNALADAGSDSPAFNSLLGILVLEQVVMRSWMCGVLDLIMDLFSIGVIINVHLAATQQRNPGLGGFVGFLMMGLWALVSFLMTPTVSLLVYRGSAEAHLAALLKHLSMWNMAMGILELITITVVGAVGYAQVSALLAGEEVFGVKCQETPQSLPSNPVWPSYCFQFQHPNLFSAFVGMRWIRLMITLLQVRKVGKSMVPVMHAILQPESRTFIMFLLLAVIASSHAYLVFPIEGNLDSLDSLLDAVLRIFRLEILGDFDLGELEGTAQLVTGKLNMTGSTGELDAEIGDSAMHYYGRGVRNSFLLFSLVVTVICMNVYIGLVSELYARAAEKKNQLFHHYLADLYYRHLCRVIAKDAVVACCSHICTRRAAPEPATEGIFWMHFKGDQILDG